jgi:hypothetical protein
MNELMPILTPVMMLSCIIVLGTGIALMLMVWSSLDTLFTTTSGWILFVGFLSTFSAAVVGFGFLAPTGMRLGKLNSSLQGRDPSPEEKRQLSRLNARIDIFDRMNFTLMVIAVGAMALLRYI